jgi:tRNA A37 threonylcarbamoyladenosine modification protein TsaB
VQELTTRRGRRGDLYRAASEALDRAGFGPRDLSGVAVGLGPGSFTGVRVCLALARGLKLAAGPDLALAGADAPTLLATAAGAELPHPVGIPIGRLRLLTVVAEPGGARAETARLISVDALAEDPGLTAAPLVVEPFAAESVPWPEGAKLVVTPRPPVGALAELVVERRLTWLRGEEAERLRPAYLLPADAVLPSAATSTARPTIEGAPAAEALGRLQREPGGRARIDAGDGALRREASDAALHVAVTGSSGAVEAALRVEPPARGGSAEIVELCGAEGASPGAEGALVAAALAAARRAGWSRVEVRVGATHADTLARLARLGFVPISHEADPGEDGERFVTLAVVLERGDRR